MSDCVHNCTCLNGIDKYKVFEVVQLYYYSMYGLSRCCDESDS
jgi:hypothetical protein